MALRFGFGTFGGGGGGGSASATTLDSLSDVDLTGAQANDVLCTTDGTSWEPCQPGTTINAQTGTTYTVLATDRGKLVTHSNASAIAVTLPQAGGTGFETGFFYTTCSIGAGLTTITPTTSTINGATSLAIGRLESGDYDCAKIFSDGTNYHVARFQRSATSTNCTTEGNCATQADTSGTGGNLDSAAGTAGTSELIFASKLVLAANYITTNTLLRACAVVGYTTSGSPPNATMRLKAGSTNLYQSNTTTIARNGATGESLTACWYLQGTAVPGASVNVEVSSVVQTGAQADWGNRVVSPVALATNGALTLQVSWDWDATTAGNSTVLRQFFVERVN